MNKRANRITSLLLTIAMVFTIVGNLATVPTQAAVSYVTAKRMVDSNKIYATDEVEVTLSVTGTPPSNVVMPNDIVLLLDKSGSMAMDPDPARFEAMIESAKEFIDLVDFNYHQVGLVDYSGNGQIGSYPLTTDADDLKSYIDNIVCGGGTYTHDAITKGAEMLTTTGRENAQPVIILLTDGEPKSQDWAINAAKKAKDAGIVFYTIALLGPNADPDTSVENLFLKELATSGNHHHFILGSVGLIDIYRTIVREIGVSAAYNVKITETVSDEFEIVPGSYSDNIPVPTVNGNTLTWDILELKANTLNLTYKVRLKDQSTRGTYALTNGSNITYQDYDYRNYALNLGATNVTIKEYAPEITSISPAEGLITGGEQVTIKGSNFRNGLTVTIGSQQALNVVVVDENTITAVVPSVGFASRGEATVTVTNDDKQSATTTYLYKAQPVITEVTPAEGPFEGGTIVTISGENIEKGATVYFGNQQAETYRYNSHMKIFVYSPVAEQAGPVDIRIVNKDGMEVTLADAFTYAEEFKPEEILPPVITGITPDSGFIEGGEQVIITGENFREGAKVHFGDLLAENVVVVSENEITLTTPATTFAAKGEVTVTVTNDDKQSATTTYLYKAQPVITEVTPTEGPFEGGTVVTILGKNIEKSAKIYFGNQEASIYRYYSNAKVLVESPVAEKEGLVDIRIVNTDGTEVTVSDAFNYEPAIEPEAILPTITNLSQSTGLLSGNESLYIEGTNFQKNMQVFIGDEEVGITRFYSSAKVLVTTPASTKEGFVDVRVVRADGGEAVVVNGFEYVGATPTITKISPATSLNTVETTVTITGTNFEAGATVYFGSEEAVSVTVVNGKSIKAVSPVSTYVGTVDVKVVNPTGRECVLADAFTYEEETIIQPIITSLSVTEGTTEGGTRVDILGKNLAKSMKVYFGTEEATLYRVYSAGKIAYKTPASAAGTVDVTVVLVDGGTYTLKDAFTFK